jgi:Superinfection immunity protein
MTTESVVAVFFGLLGLALWMVPSLIAFSRRHPKRKAILLTDLLLSWTVIGWFFALGWALRGWEDPVTEDQPEKVKSKVSAA